MRRHPIAATFAGIVAGRDLQLLGAQLSETARLRALLPGGPIEAHGRAEVAARIHGFFADFDTATLVESAGEEVGDRVLIHYRLWLTLDALGWVCTQTAVCTLVDGQLAVVDLLCSGLREDPDGPPSPAAEAALPASQLQVHGRAR